MIQTTVAARLTHRYRAGWGHLDTWGRDFNVRLTPPRVVEEHIDYDTGDVALMWATLAAGLTKPERDEAARALVSTLSGSRCQHEHDCCGCASYSARVLRRKGRKVLIRTSIWYNY